VKPAAPAKRRRSAKGGDRTRQFAALPCRKGKGGLEVMLVTSRDTGRWVLPKGWPMKGLTGAEAAAREAFEEAGLRGKVKGKPLGSYDYPKRLACGDCVPVTVRVYRLDVTRELDDWPERGQRTRRWVTPAEAASLVAEADLAALLAGLAPPKPPAAAAG
jgi:8-oxo-dGTP pyrophosphatase MutT (NUDIX family)